VICSDLQIEHKTLSFNVNKTVQMSDVEDLYYDVNDQEFNDFIVDDQPDVSPQNEDSRDNEDALGDKILQLSSSLKPQESQPQKILKAHIAVLVSALGGIDHTSELTPPPYKLGHDALACLKDIKRWIKAIDEKQKSFDVALACAESGLVINELLVILCQWEQQCKNKVPIKNVRITEKIMLSCLELLVLLTWPVEYSKDLSEQQKLAFSSIRKTQVSYKSAILHYKNGLTLKAVIRLVLPTIEKSRRDRDSRDNSILKLVILFFRNVIAIEPANISTSTKSSKQIVTSDNLPADITFDDISHTALLTAFKKNKVLMLLLTISGSIGSDFDKEIFGLSCLECIYLLIKGLNADDLLNYAKHKYCKNTTLTQSNLNEQNNKLPSMKSTADYNLQELLNKEALKKNVQKQSISTRHGKFGTLLSIRNNDTAYVVSGQEALQSTNSTLEKMDKSKAWNDRNTFKYDSDEYVIRTVPIFINQNGLKIMLEFIETILISGCFNNLIENIGSVFSGSTDLETVDEYDKASFFYTIAWFFNYKRQKLAIDELVIDNLEEQDLPNYGSVGAGLGEINFILLISYFRQSYERRQWSSLHVAMICLRELLQISNTIFNRPKATNEVLETEEDELDRELAEGIIRKLFSFSDFLNQIVNIPQTAAKHSPDYLKVCISVVHIILKSFESFANEDIKLYIQHKRKKKSINKKRVNDLDKATEDSMRDLIDGSDDEFYEQRVREVTRERKLDFQASESRFFHTSIVSSYIEFLSRYEELSNEEIKLCISYFHRLFVKRKDFTGLYRLDFMHLLQRLRKDTPRSSSIRKHVDEFIYYFMKKFKQAFERFPMPIEILFPRFENQESKVYFATGELYEKPQKRSLRPQLAKSIEFTRDFTLEEKFKILISILNRQGNEPLLDWLTEEIDRILSDRILDPNGIFEIKMVIRHQRHFITNAYFRLMLNLTGFDVPYSIEEPCELKPSTTNENLSTCIELLKTWRGNTPAYDDGQDPLLLLRLKEDDFEDPETEYNDFNDDSIAFETIPNSTSGNDNWNELDRLDDLERQLNSNANRSGSSNLEKGIARKKRHHRSSQEKNERKKETPKKSKPSSRGPPRSFNVTSDDEDRPLKSSEYVHESDDDSDDEKVSHFFAREERLRKMLETSGGIVNATQLAEFKKAWAELESSNGESTTTSVFKALETTSMIVNENGHEETESSLGNRSPQRSTVDDLKNSVNDGLDEEMITDNSPQYLSAEDNDEFEQTHSVKRQKRVIVDDDDDD
jgi:replication fork protection complex subunit Tof1/Swi1